MNIEQLMPKETINRDSFIENTIIPDETINFLGIDLRLIRFKFKTDRPVYEDRINIITVDGIELHNFGGDYEQ